MEKQEIRWNEQGLIPVITQDAQTNAVLMQAYMNEQSLHMTLESGYMVYYSRSRQEIWEKGKNERTDAESRIALFGLRRGLPAGQSGTKRRRCLPYRAIFLLFYACCRKRVAG